MVRVESAHDLLQQRIEPAGVQSDAWSLSNCESGRRPEFNASDHRSAEVAFERFVAAKATSNRSLVQSHGRARLRKAGEEGPNIFLSKPIVTGVVGGQRDEIVRPWGGGRMLGE
jgi:hypothetical protein